MYQGIVTEIQNLQPIPGADRIVQATCHGHTVVVGINTKPGDLGVFFPADGKFSMPMLVNNKLLKSQGGYFEEHGRIRAQKFKGVKSEGIWLPINCIEWTGVNMDSWDHYAIGSTIDILNGKEICSKYFTPATQRALKTTQKAEKRGETKWFRKVGDTPQLRYVLPTIPDGSLIYFTEKLHGTSGRYGFVPHQKPVPWWRSLFGLAPKLEYRESVGSKNVIISEGRTTGFYTDESFRTSIQEVKLHKGETLYYEIVGYTANGTPIMPPQPVKDKELATKYGPQMHYRYGQEKGTWGVYVYRITRVNEDGVVTELSWPQVKGRCVELGLKYCPDIHYGPWYKNELGIIGGTSDPEYYKLEEVADNCLEGPSSLDPSHIREGIVLRIEEPNGRIWFAKHKSFSFKVLEGIIKEQDNYVDREEVS
jgi:hypothetical protein